VNASVAITTAAPPEGIHHLLYARNNGARKKKDTHHIRGDNLKNRFDHNLPARLREAFATPRVDFLPDPVLDIGEDSCTISPDHRA
jgi:hypothetical protein